MKNAENKEAVWTIDLKSTGSVYKGEPKNKANVTLILSDDTFQQLADGKVRLPSPPLLPSLGVLKECRDCVGGSWTARRRI